jgi:2-iminoacetate synthase
MFSDQLQDLVGRAARIGETPAIPSGGMLALLEKAVLPGGLSPDELIEVLNGISDPRNRDLIKDYAAQVRRPHDRDILLLPPLYFSSICENRCAYCDFTADGARLSLDDFAREVDALLALGYRSIELVSSQDPELYIPSPHSTPEAQRYSVDGPARYFELVHERLAAKGGGMLTSNIPPLDLDSFRRLRAAGLDCYLVWLEAFHPGQYRTLHPGRGPKVNQAFRLDSFERAVEAGIPHLAGAFLKGLYDWRREEALLYALDHHLKSRNGRGFSIIGTPRLKGDFAGAGPVKDFLVSDDDYELNIALDRILFDGILWLQTREPFSLNSRLIGRYGGGVILTLTCSTAPGGYAKPSSARAQFPIHQQGLAESVASLEEKGFRVVFDWTGETLAGFQRGSGVTPRS